LAIQVEREKALGKINDRDAQHVLFYVGGVACLTLAINATTCSWVVNTLGITAMPREQLRLLKMVYGALVNLSSGQFPDEFCSIVGIHPGDDKFPDAVVDRMSEMMTDIDHRVSSLQVRNISNGPLSIANQRQVKSNRVVVEEYNHRRDLYLRRRERAKETRRHMVQDESGIGDLSVFKNLGGHKELFKDLTDKHQARDMAGMSAFILEKGVDASMAQTVNCAFLKLVERNYWILMQEEVLRLGSDLAGSLLLSCRTAQSRDKVGDLCDYDEMLSSLPKDPAKSVYADATIPWKIFSDDVSFVSNTSRGTQHRSALHKFVNSSAFNMTFVVLIILNCITVIIDELVRNDENSDHAIWLTTEILFTSIFFVEFVFKFADKGWLYFKKAPDLFDFFLLVMGIMGIICDIAMAGSSDLDRVHVLRFARIFRVLRLLRVFRLLSVRLDMSRYVSVEVEVHMHRLTAMVCFSTAHLKAQRDLVIFFGGNAKVDEVEEKEIARCVLQSQTNVYRACEEAMDQELKLELAKPDIMVDLRITLLSKRICDAISRFIDAAHEAGALCERDAHEVRHPVNHMLQHMQGLLNDLDAGIVETHTLTSRGTLTFGHTFSRRSADKPGDKSAKVAPSPEMESCASSASYDMAHARSLDSATTKSDGMEVQDVSPPQSPDAPIILPVAIK